MANLLAISLDLSNTASEINTSQGTAIGLDLNSTEQSKFGPDFPSVKNFLGQKIPINDAKPRIIFISDFIIDDVNQGKLIVFDAFDTTGYEFWRRDLLKKEEFSRLTSLTTTFLQQERERLRPYIEQVIGLSHLGNNILAFLDTSVPPNTLVEYKIRLIKIPDSLNDFKLTSVIPSFTILASQTNLFTGSSAEIFQATDFQATDIVGVNQNMSSPTTDLTNVVYGSGSVFGWMVGLMNREVDFFAGFPIIKAQILQKNNVLFPASPEFAFGVVRHAVQLYGFLPTMVEIFQEIGNINEILFKCFVNSFNQPALTFDFSKFRDCLSDLGGIIGSIGFINTETNELVNQNFSVDLLNLIGFSKLMNILQILSNTEPAFAGTGNGKATTTGTARGINTGTSAGIAVGLD